MATGMLWLNILAGGNWRSAIAAAAGVVAAWTVKFLYLLSIGEAETSTGSAIGLPDGTAVRPLMPPHTGGNYLLDEMVYRVGRKHLAKVGRLAWIAGVILPIGLVVAGAASGGWVAIVLAVVAAVVGTLGVLADRWLFFARATHTVALYYRGDE